MTDVDPASQLTPFPDMLGGLESGKVAAELTSAFAVLVEEVNRLGKKGSLTLKVEVKPAGEPGRMVFVSPSITLNTPDPDPFPSQFFVGNGGATFREDPFDNKMFDDAPKVVDTDGDTPRVAGEGGKD